MNRAAKILDRLTDTAPKTFAAAAAMLISIAIVDYFTGYEISFSSFYLLPILLVTWRTSLKLGLATSFLSAVLWLLDDYWIIEHEYSHPLIPYWNAAVRFVFFMLSAVLMDKIRSLLERSRAEARLKSDMIHAVSHEFNNALTSMSAALFLLEETEPARSDVRSRFYSAISAAQQKLKLYVKNILNEARMENGKFKLEIKPLALRDLTAEALLPMEELLKEKDIKLTRDLPPVPVLVDADRDALALVISNLLGNAVKYTPQGGTITVRLSAFGGPENKVVFAVDDSGPGISLEDIKKITAGFYRTAEGKAAAEGFGLGLKISNELLALHGSRLEIASEKGKGSSFSFELPALPPAAPGGTVN